MQDRANGALSLGKQVIDGLERKDSVSIVAILAEDVVLHVPFPLVAGENTTGTRRQAGQAVHDYLRESNRLTAKVVFENKLWRTTDDGLAMFVADGKVTLSDGRPYDNHYLFLFEARDGKITQWWEYYNPVIAAVAFGAPLDTIPC